MKKPRTGDLVDGGQQWLESGGKMPKGKQDRKSQIGTRFGKEKSEQLKAHTLHTGQGI